MKSEKDEDGIRMKNENERDVLCMLRVVRSMLQYRHTMALCASFCNFLVIYVFFWLYMYFLVILGRQIFFEFLALMVGIVTNIGSNLAKTSHVNLCTGTGTYLCWSSKWCGVWWRHGGQR